MQFFKMFFFVNLMQIVTENIQGLYILKKFIWNLIFVLFYHIWQPLKFYF